MNELFHLIYIQPKWLVCVVGIGVVLLWGIIARLSSRDDAIYLTIRVIAAALFLVIMLGILYDTILGREPNADRVLLLVPFSGKEYFSNGEEFYRVLVMNIVLFVPLGMSLPFILSNHKGKHSGRRGSSGRSIGGSKSRKAHGNALWIRRHPVATTIIFGLLLSLTIEILQYVLKIGEAEIDDLWTNTLGTAIGTLSYAICWAGNDN